MPSTSAPGHLEFDAELIRRYDRPGPRYTSYPTAPQFHPGLGVQELGRILRQSSEPEQPAPLGLYVHLPFCSALCWFCGCNIVPTKDRSRGDRYVEVLEREIELVTAELGDKRRQVVELHLGGGSPTFMPAEVLERLVQVLKRHFEFAPGFEASFEADPRETSEEHVELLASEGFNRMSVGLQDLDERVQRAVHRVQNEEITVRTIEWARKRGFRGVNVDLMYGLPHQSVESFDSTLTRMLAMEPDRVALFNFAYLPELFKHQRAIKRDTLPSPEAKLAILESAVGQLTRAGYVFIGMDHFARPDDELAVALAEGRLARSFQGYCIDRGADLIGLGASSISMVGRSYSQNAKLVEPWAEAVEAGRLPVVRGIELSDEDVLRRSVIWDLMCRSRVDFASIGERFGVDFRERFADALERLDELQRDGLVELGEGAIEVTPRGRFLVRNVAMLFDAYLDPAGTARFSRTV